MATADASVIEVLSSPDVSLRRLLVRDAAGHAVEAIECTPARAESLPWGGVFAAYDRREGRVLLGPVLARRLTDLRPSPLATLGLLRWLLQDLERLHASGGAHGAIHPDGVGFDATGLFQVRPSFAFPQPVANTPQMQDVAAVGRVLAALTSVAALEAEGVARARLWWNGLGIEGGRVGFPDARAARQALTAAVGRRDLDVEMSAFLARVAGRLPPAAVAFRVRPVAATRVGAGPDGVSAQRMADARAILDAELSDFRQKRFDRSQERVQEERRRIATQRAEGAALRAAPMITGAVVDDELGGPLRVVLDPRRAQAARDEQESLLSRGDAIFRVKVGATEEGFLETLDADAAEDARIIALSVDSGVDSGEPERRYSVDEVPVVDEIDVGAVPKDADDDPTTEVEELSAVTDLEPLTSEIMEVPAPVAGRRESEDRLDSEIRRFREEMERRRTEEQARRGAAEAARAEEEARRAARREAEREAMRVEAERREAARIAAEREEAEAEAAMIRQAAVIGAEVDAAEALAEEEAALAPIVAAYDEAGGRESEVVESEAAWAASGWVDEDWIEAARGAQGEAEGDEEEEEREEKAVDAEVHGARTADAEAARVEAERVEAERVEAERIAAEKAEAERIEAARLEAERVEAERIAAEKAEAERVEAERLEAERVEAERLAAEKAEAERVEAERLEAERVEAERLAAEKAEAERIEAERLEAERVEAERLAAEKAEAERIEAERIEAERLAAEKAEAERIEAERIEAERVAAEKAEAERIEAERVEAERVAAEKAEAERIEAERVEAERVAAEKAEAERIEAERIAAPQAEVARLEAAREAARRAAAARDARKAPPPDPDPDTSPGERRRSRRDQEGLSLDPERGLPASGRWEGATGISGKSDREQELGPGKWTEQGRSLDELRRNLPTGPTRPMEMDEPAARSPMVPILVAVAVLVLAAVAWLVFH